MFKYLQLILEIMKLKYIIPVLFAVLLTACFDDETNLGTEKISVISIDTTKLQKEYNIDKNEVYIMDPVIAQDKLDLPLSYEWQVNYKVYSDSVVFKYIGDELGSFDVRLKVSNEDGSAFYTFRLHVNSPYEEGIAMLSADRNENMQLSFMRKFTAEEQAAGAVEKFELNCLTTNNPEYQFVKSPSDMAKRLNQLFISCRNTPTVYAINCKTFELENVVAAPEYPDFSPIKMYIPDGAATEGLVYSEGGKIYSLATLEGIIMPHSMLDSKYSSVMFTYFAGYNPYWYMWDNADGEYSLQYFAGYNMKDIKEEGTFDGHEPLAMFEDISKDCFTTLTKKGGAFYKTTLGYFFYKTSGEWPDYVYHYDLREQKAIVGDCPITTTTPYVGSAKYKTLLYAQGNKIYRWYYSDNSFPTTPWVTIDNLSGAEITSLSLSPNENEVYVGVYQPNESGQNGHVYVLNTDTGRAVAGSPYLNVGYKPVKIMYKVK